MSDFLNSTAIGTLNWGDVLIGIPACIVGALMCLAIVGAMIGFVLCEPYRRETHDRPYRPHRETRP